MRSRTKKVIISGVVGVLIIAVCITLPLVLTNDDEPAPIPEPDLPDRPDEAGWGEFTEWSDCSVTCGSGQETRSRYCNPGDDGPEINCPGYPDATFESRECSLDICKEGTDMVKDVEEQLKENLLEDDLFLEDNLFLSRYTQCVTLNGAIINSGDTVGYGAWRLEEPQFQQIINNTRSTRNSFISKIEQGCGDIGINETTSLKTIMNMARYGQRETQKNKIFQNADLGTLYVFASTENDFGEISDRFEYSKVKFLRPEVPKSQNSNLKKNHSNRMKLGSLAEFNL